MLARSRITCLSITDAPATSIYTLSLHDALPIFAFHMLGRGTARPKIHFARSSTDCASAHGCRDRKSTRLNSSHVETSYAVFCLKKKKRGQSTPQVLPPTVIHLDLDRAKSNSHDC